MFEIESGADFRKINFNKIPSDPSWNLGEEREFKMHKIHSYPAKFPAFLTTKALSYAKKNKIAVNKIADIFCGCGTVAFESKRNNIDFWGCDINPVATMIAKVKSGRYDTERLKRYLASILNCYISLKKMDINYETANERLKYWYGKEQYEKIFRLKCAIEDAIPSRSRYRIFFLCAFSNILKPTSRWLAKSIKPQVDPDKNFSDAVSIFKKQCEFMIDANEESSLADKPKIEIQTANFLDESIRKPKVDMIITSPPYVTSYEYADLHQLSSLWLDYAEDYRNLRFGSIGSLYHKYNFERELKRLNNTGTNVVLRLYSRAKSKARSVAKYFLDMQKIADACYYMLTDSGAAVFVIGNTEYKGVKIKNAEHLCESLISSGFKKIMLTKRQITGKTLTPYRDKFGKFSSNHNSKKIYSEEFIVIGRKL